MARLTRTGSRTSGEVAAALDDHELAAGELGEGATLVDVLAHVAVAVDDERRDADVAALCLERRPDSGSSSSWASSLAARISPVDSIAHATASSNCFVECGSTSCSPKKNSTQRRCSLVMTCRLNSSHPVGSSRIVVPRRRGRGPVRLRRAEVRARRARWRRTRRPARGGSTIRSTIHQLAWQWATTHCRVGVGCVEHGDDVGHVGGSGVIGDARRSAGTAVAAPVERDHPVAAWPGAGSAPSRSASA